jgi:hypothetical protein
LSYELAQYSDSAELTSRIFRIELEEMETL